MFSEYILYSLKTSVTHIRFIFFVGSVFLIRNELLKSKKILLIAFILPVFVVSVDIIFQSIFGFNTIGMSTWDPGRNSSFFGDEFISGSYLTRMLPLSLFYFYFFLEEKKNLSAKLILLFFVVVVNCAVFLSGERTAFLLTILLNIYLIMFSQF